MENDKSATRILVVDDQRDMLHMMEMILSRDGYRIETARSAREALRIATDFCPHIVISDIGMPEMDGCEMMAILRRQSGGQAFKSIALTGYGLPYDQERMKEAGFDLCLLKPIDFATLGERIEQMLEARADSQIASSPHHANDNAVFQTDSRCDAKLEKSRQMAAEH